MPLGSQNVSEVIHDHLGSLRACLVEGDAEQRNRERRIRHRALLISILMQSAVLAVLVLVPLFGKTGRFVLAIATPLPPYSPYKGAPHDAGLQHPHRPPHNVCHFCAPTNIPPIIVTHDSPPPGDDTPLESLGSGIPGAPDGVIPIPDARTNVPPPYVDRHRTQPSVVHVTHLDPAMLIHRVEPLYPPLPKQIHKEGRVELRAIIATDGSIQSLEIVGGDPMFYQSALEAVRQWHYKPTILNGQAVEIDTHITVIYIMQH
jgi:periplasmic protein TonB